MSENKRIKDIFSNDWCGIDIFLTEILHPLLGDYRQGYDVLTDDKTVKEKAAQANIQEIKHSATFDLSGSDLKVFDITVSDNKSLLKVKLGYSQSLGNISNNSKVRSSYFTIKMLQIVLGAFLM